MIPTYEEFMIPTLQILSDEQARKNKDLRLALQQRCGLTDEDMDVLIPSGSSKTGSNMNWAITYLFHAGLVMLPPKPAAT